MVAVRVPLVIINRYRTCHSSKNMIAFLSKSVLVEEKQTDESEKLVGTNFDFVLGFIHMVGTNSVSYAHSFKA